MSDRTCPRCRAAGITSPLDQAGGCEACGTVWSVGELGQPVAVGRREVAP